MGAVLGQGISSIPRRDIHYNEEESGITREGFNGLGVLLQRGLLRSHLLRNTLRAIITADDASVPCSQMYMKDAHEMCEGSQCLLTKANNAISPVTSPYRGKHSQKFRSPHSYSSLTSMIPARPPIAHCC